MGAVDRGPPHRCGLRLLLRGRGNVRRRRDLLRKWPDSNLAGMVGMFYGFPIGAAVGAIVGIGLAYLVARRWLTFVPTAAIPFRIRPTTGRDGTGTV